MSTAANLSPGNGRGARSGVIRAEDALALGVIATCAALVGLIASSSYFSAGDLERLRAAKESSRWPRSLEEFLATLSLRDIPATTLLALPVVVVSSVVMALAVWAVLRTAIGANLFALLGLSLALLNPATLFAATQVLTGAEAYVIVALWVGLVWAWLGNAEGTQPLAAVGWWIAWALMAVALWVSTTPGLVVLLVASTGPVWLIWGLADRSQGNGGSNKTTRRGVLLLWWWAPVWVGAGLAWAPPVANRAVLQERDLGDLVSVLAALCPIVVCATFIGWHKFRTSAARSTAPATQRRRSRRPAYRAGLVGLVTVGAGGGVVIAEAEPAASARSWVEATTSTLIERPAEPVFDNAAPPDVAPGRTSNEVLTALGVQAPFGVPSTLPLLIDARGDLRLAEHGEAADIREGPRDECGWPVRTRPVPLAELSAAAEGTVLKLTYLTGIPVDLQVSLGKRSARVRVEPPYGDAWFAVGPGTALGEAPGTVRAVVTPVDGNLGPVGICVVEFASGALQIVDDEGR